MKEETIADWLFNDFEEELSTVQSNEAIANKLELFVNSKIAIKISGTGYNIPEPGEVSKYNVACKFMIKHNKKLKKFINKNTEYRRFNREYADDNEELVKLSRQNLMPGTYYALLKSHDYAVLQIEQHQKYIYRVDYSFYLIGKHREKYKDEFFQMFDKYEKIAKETSKEQELWTAKTGRKEAKFKSFDRCVIRGKKEIIEYIDRWVNNIPKYHQYGMIPKLSFLLYGRPGTGKSTFYQALADYLDISLVNCLPPEYFVTMGGADDDDDDYGPPRGMRLRRGRGGNPGSPDENSIFAIDDIDCVCTSREEDKSKQNSSTTANLLSFLDNPDSFYFKAKDGKYYLVSIVVATTNYYDQLDEAVKRFGRFDKTIEMQYFNKQEAEEMCSYYDLTLDKVLPDVDYNAEGFEILPAELQAKCLDKIDSSLKK